MFPLHPTWSNLYQGRPTSTKTHRAIEAVSFGLAFLSPRFGSLGRTGIFLGDWWWRLRLQTIWIQYNEHRKKYPPGAAPIDPKVTSNQVDCILILFIPYKFDKWSIYMGFEYDWLTLHLSSSSSFTILRWIHWTPQELLQRPAEKQKIAIAWGASAILNKPDRGFALEPVDSWLMIDVHPENILKLDFFQLLYVSRSLSYINQ